MKSRIDLFIFTTLLLFVTASCTQEVEDLVFDYNLKSAKVIETNNNFGLELLKTIFETEDAPNIMISPTSVSIALGMAYNGAETTTKEAFERVLNYEGLTREEINEITKELISVLMTNVDGNLLELANSLWNDEGFPIKQEFIDLNANYFDAEVREIDLQTAEALEAINRWASEQTHGKIKKILDEIEPTTAMILINAIYFNCVWETEFSKDDTSKESFFTETGEEFGKVDMMQTESTFNAAFTSDFSAVELPYNNRKFSMFLFLPAQGKGVDELVQKLDGATWENWMSEFHETAELKVHMPKFKFDFERSLKEDLQAMGLEIAFSGDADFSGMSNIPLFIDKVIHKSYIGVNEEGTEAAAVTAVVMKWESASPGLWLNRPFLFAITENSSKSILFIGKVSKPSY